MWGNRSELQLKIKKRQTERDNKGFIGEAIEGTTVNIKNPGRPGSASPTLAARSSPGINNHSAI